MKSYLGLFKMSFKGETQYRSKAFSGILTQLFWGLLSIYLYTAFMRGTVIDGFSVRQMATYIWLGQSMFVLRYILLPKNCAKEIESGDVCYKFTRPLDLYNQWYAEHIGYKIASTLLRSFPIIIIAFLLPGNLRMMLPTSFTAFLLYLVSLIIGGMIASAIAMITVFLTFKTMSANGTQKIMNTITSILGGMSIPLPLMPSGVQKVLNYLPFRYIIDLPNRIYIGNIEIKSALILILISLAWLVALILLGKLLIKCAAKTAVIQGG